MNETILLVDDNPNNLAVLFDHLDSLEYRVLVMEDGITAVEQSSKIAPHLILIDVRMPGMDGYETCRAMKANPELVDVPVIFLSALDDTDDRLKGFAAGGVDYISKPINVDELTARIQNHLTLARLQRELSATNQELESIVMERTVELSSEIERRKQEQSEKQLLLDLLHEQNRQLYRFIQHMLRERPSVHMLLSQIFKPQILDELSLVSADLHSATKLSVEQGLSRAPHFQHVQSARLRISQLKTYLGNFSHADNGDLDVGPNMPSPVDQLTPREREVLCLIADGLSSSEIALNLQISDITVRSYRAQIMRKLDISHTAGLVKFALRHNLTTLDNYTNETKKSLV